MLEMPLMDTLLYFCYGSRWKAVPQTKTGSKLTQGNFAFRVYLSLSLSSDPELTGAPGYD